MAEPTAIVRPDSKKRFSLGRHIVAADRYKVFPTSTGGVTLEPVHEEEEVEQ